MKKTLLKLIQWFFKIVLALLVIGFVYEQISRVYYNSKRPNNDEFITINGRQLHYHKQGNSPKGTVIFESGMGSDYLHWHDIQPEVAKTYTTISYDRAGILWSDKAATKTLKSITSDLEQLLKDTQCPKPYILVAHSLGGVTSRPFIEAHQNDMAGVVFVDVSHPLQLKKSSADLKSAIQKPPFWLIRFLNAIGVIRLMYNIQPFTDVVSENHWFNENVKNYFHRILPGFLQEWGNDTLLLKEAESYTDFSHVPLAIITATYPYGNALLDSERLEKEYLNIHHSLQKELLKLSTNSRQVLATESGHYIALQQPDLIIDTILTITNNN